MEAKIDIEVAKLRKLEAERHQDAEAIAALNAKIDAMRKPAKVKKI